MDHVLLDIIARLVSPFLIVIFIQIVSNYIEEDVFVDTVKVSGKNVFRQE